MFRESEILGILNLFYLAIPINFKQAQLSFFNTIFDFKTHLINKVDGILAIFKVFSNLVVKSLSLSLSLFYS